MKEILEGNFEKSVLEWEKNDLKKNLPVLPAFEFFHKFILLVTDYTDFLVQFGIDLHLWVFQKAEIALVEAAREISAFWETHSCKLNSKLNSKPHDYL